MLKSYWNELILLTLAFMWGSSFILMKKGLVVYSFQEVAAMRMGIAAICLFPMALKHLFVIQKKYWIYIILTGFLGNAIPAFLFTKAQTELPSSLTGVFNSLVPFFTVLISLFILKKKILKVQLIGIFLGLVGSVSLILFTNSNVGSGNVYYIGFVVLATMCYASSIHITKLFLSDVSSVAISSLAFLTIGIPLLIYLSYTNVVEKTLTHPEGWYAFSHIAILSIVSTAIAVILFYFLIKRTSPLYVSSITYLIPVMAIFWGVLDGESINFLQSLAIILTIFGVYFINKTSNIKLK